MIINFKNGYSVRVTDTKGKTKKEIISAARKSLKKYMDAELIRNPDTHTSFTIPKLTAAIELAEEGRMKPLEAEIGYLLRDLRYDASESHKNYPKMYRQEVLEKLLREDGPARSRGQYIRAMDLVDKTDLVDQGTKDQIHELVETIKRNWGFGTVQDSDEEEDLRQFQGYISDEETGEIVYETDDPYADSDEVEFELEDKMNELRAKYHGDSDFEDKYSAYVMEFHRGKPTKQTKLFDFPEFAQRVHDESNELEVSVKNWKTGEKITQNYPDETEAKKNFPELVRRIYRAEVEDSKTSMRDIPYYEPTDYPQIDSDYGTDRLLREIAHEGKTGPEKDIWMKEIEEVFDEIDEFVEGGRDVLVQAGWTKADARHAIDSRYTKILEALKNVKATKQYNTLLKKVTQLKKAWDLER